MEGVLGEVWRRERVIIVVEDECVVGDFVGHCLADVETEKQSAD
jgi:hypothetical protein